jgi:hypothetical protein
MDSKNIQGLIEAYQSIYDVKLTEEVVDNAEVLDEAQGMDIFSAIKNTASPIFTKQKPAQQPRKGMGGAFDKIVSNTKPTQAAATKFFTRGLKPAAAKPATPAKPAAAAKPATPAKPAAAAKPATPAKPAAAAKPATPAKPAAAATKPAAAPAKTPVGSVGGVKFERRAATRAELDAARAAREAAKGAGKSKSEQELSAVKAGVEASKVKKEEYDAYDLVLEYLLSQGHVETVEEALYVMMEMDAEVIQDIVSEAAEPRGGGSAPNVPPSVYKFVDELPSKIQGFMKGKPAPAPKPATK